jgi:outer membrane lipoprotein-sorting protein
MISSSCLFGQSDDEAIRILDKFSSMAKTAPSVSIDFDLIYSDVLEDYSDTVSGKVVLDKDKYKLTLPDNIIWYDGTTSWSYLPDVYEVTITEPTQANDIFTSRPSLIFTAYKEGYKCRLVEETNNSYIIDLYPEDPKSDLIRLRLSLDKKEYTLLTFEYKRKDGFTATLLANKYDLSFFAGNGYFTFNKSNYQDLDIIDMR